LVNIAWSGRDSRSQIQPLALLLLLLLLLHQLGGMHHPRVNQSLVADRRAPLLAPAAVV